MPHKEMHYDFGLYDVELFITVNQAFRDYEEFIKNAVMPEISAKFDIKIRELLVLICIDSAKQAITSADVASLMRKDPATMTRSTLVLVGKEFIQSIRSRTDSRGKVLQMTEAGKMVVSRYRSLFNDAKAMIDHDQQFHSRTAQLSRHEQALQSIASRAETLADVSSETGFSKRLGEAKAGAAQPSPDIIY